MSVRIGDIELELDVVRRQLDVLCRRREERPGLDASQAFLYAQLCRQERLLLTRLAELASATG